MPRSTANARITPVRLGWIVLSALCLASLLWEALNPAPGHLGMDAIPFLHAMTGLSGGLLIVLLAACQRRYWPNPSAGRRKT